MAFRTIQGTTLECTSRRAVSEVIAWNSLTFKRIHKGCLRQNLRIPCFEKLYVIQPVSRIRGQVLEGGDHLGHFQNSHKPISHNPLIWPQVFRMLLFSRCPSLFVPLFSLQLLFQNNWFLTFLVFSSTLHLARWNIEEDQHVAILRKSYPQTTDAKRWYITPKPTPSVGFT